MSDDMFAGRKFTIPYQTATDEQVASMARAQIVTRTASPGQVIQVGDKVMAYGITPQQAKMGDLDVKVRSYQQLSNEAQDAVRRNIQWQYGEQVGAPIEKSLIARLLGIPHLLVDKKNLYPEVTGRDRRRLPPADIVRVKPPQEAAPAPAAAAPAKTASAKAPSKTSRAAKPTASPVRVPAAAPEDEHEEPTGMEVSAPALEVVPVSAAVKNYKSTAERPRKPTTPTASGEGMSPGTQATFNNAFSHLALAHKKLRSFKDWSITRTEESPNRRVITAKKDWSDETERHELEFQPSTKTFVHRYFAPGKSTPIETHLDTHEALLNHVLTRNDAWGF